MSQKLILLTSPIDPEQTALLAQTHRVVVMAPNHADFLATAVESDAIVVRDPLPVALFGLQRRLRIVVRHGAGTDMIPIDAATVAGVAVANVPGANARSVAEFAVGQMIALTRKTFRSNALMHSEGWAPARHVAGAGTDLFGKTVAILGSGAVGQALARICTLGFEMNVFPVRREGSPSLAEALAQADFLVIACPLTPETRGLVSAAMLALMKPDAYVVNVARGAVVDEAALALALAEGRLAGAALDVFGEQPLPVESPLLRLDNVILSPHAAGISKESMKRMSVGAVGQIAQAFNGELPSHLVNKSAVAAIQHRWAILDGVGDSQPAWG